MSSLVKPTLIAAMISAGLASVPAYADDATPVAVNDRTVGLIEALELAKRHDPQLKYALYNYQAEQEQDDVRLSSLLPNVNLSSSYRYQYVSSDFYIDTPIENRAQQPNSSRYYKDQDDYTVQLRMQQSLINVAAWDAYSSAKEAVKGSQYTYARAEQELIYRLAQAYLGTLLAAQQVYINQEKLESLQLKLDQIERMNELGVGGRLNVLRATSSRDVARSDLLQAKSKLADSKTLLENITGTPVTIPSEWVTQGHKVVPSMSEGDRQDWLQAIQNNSTLLAEKANVRSKELEADARSAQHLPTLDFSLAYREDHTDNIYAYGDQYIASLNLTVPIYSGGRTSAQARQAEAGYNAAMARYEKTLSDKTQVVKLAFTQLSSYQERLHALEESRKSSQAFLDAAERQADLSLGSQVDVLEARTELYDVRLEFANTLSDYLMADLNLLLETGQLTQATLADYDQLFSQKAR